MTSGGGIGSPPSVGFCKKLSYIARLLPIIMMVGLAIGLPITIVPDLAHDTFGKDAFFYTGLFGGIQGFMALIYGPIIGAMSDRFGRKPVLLFAVAFYGIQYLAYVVSGSNYWAFAIANACVGYISGMYSVLMALIVDLIPMNLQHIRPAVMSYMIGFWLIGTGVGPIGGTFLSEIGTPWVFRASLAMVVLSLPLIYYILPSTEEMNRIHDHGGLEETDEGVVVEKHHLAEEEEAVEASDAAADVEKPNDRNPLLNANGKANTNGSGSGAIQQQQQKRKKTKESFLAQLWRMLKTNSKLRTVTFMIWTNQMADQTIQNLVMLYLNENLSNFTTRDQLIFFMIFMIVAAFGLFILVNQLKKYVGTLNTVRLGLIFNFIGIAGYGLVDAKWQAFALATTGMISVGVYPSCATLIAGVCDYADVGAAQGIGGGARMLAEGLSPFAFGLLLQKFRHTSFPGAPFVIAACFCLLALLITFFLKGLDPVLIHGKLCPVPGYDPSRDAATSAPPSVRPSNTTTPAPQQQEATTIEEQSQ